LHAASGQASAPRNLSKPLPIALSVADGGDHGTFPRRRRALSADRAGIANAATASFRCGPIIGCRPLAMHQSRVKASPDEFLK
jgi:hypothetical protein